MGLIERVKEDGTSEFAILSDIQGMEDFLGDMDFKVTGTDEGVTAIQMDIKVHGLSRDILEKALKQAKEGRMHIMGKMMEELKAPRPDLSKYAPRAITMNIDPDKVRIVIGPGGKTINRIVDETGVKIDISEDIPGLVKHIQRRSGRSRSCSPRNRASDQRSGSRRSLRRNCNEDNELRRIHRGSSGQGRPSAHFQDG